ncbi:transporter substrate-binding domain-containing protein [Paucidesulfovibrio longus]|uniref:transporter substrate-binding domain-containing protein n=1 Tax=Paucidesulfovibrio longus TaxID=889 RepID=UPI0003B3B0C9|nr:transporter substrate-binding domain-containing protein [Paucidesulfovibrio longus]
MNSGKNDRARPKALSARVWRRPWLRALGPRASLFSPALFLSVILAVFLALSGPLCGAALASSADSPDRGEKAPVIIACPDHHPPFTLRNDAGEPAGLLVDLWRRWSVVTGIPVTFKVGTWEETEEWVRTGEADMHSGLIRTPQRQRWMAFSQPLFEVDSALVTPLAAQERTLAEGIQDLRIAVARHSPWEGWLRERQPDVAVVAVADEAAGLRSVREGLADGVFAELSSVALALELSGRSGEFRVTIQGDMRRQLHAAGRREDAELMDAVDRGLAAITLDDLVELERRWLPGPAFRLVAQSQGNLRLTGVEDEWIAAHPLIRVGVAAGLPPLRFADASGKPSGMVPDYVDLIGQRAGLQVEMVPGMDPALRFGALRRGEVDALACVLPTPSLRQEFLFTKPFLRLPSVIVTRTDAPFLSGLTDVLGKTVAMPANAGRTEFLYRDYPELDLRLTESVAEALEEVSLGLAYATVGDLPTLTASIRSLGLTNLKVAARTEYEYDEFSLAVRPGMPHLTSILNRAVESLNAGDRDTVASRWVDAEMAPDEKYEAFWNLTLRVGGMGALILALLLLWNWRLNKEVRRRRKTEDALAQAERELREIYDHVPVGIFKVSMDDAVLSMNREMLRLGGYESMEELEAQGGRVSRNWYADFSDRDRMLELLREHGEIKEFLYKARRRDGSIIWVSQSARLKRDAQGEPVHVSGYALDATERIEALESVRRSEARFKAIVINSPFVILSMDDDLRLELPLDSPAVERITSYRPDELRGQLFVDYVHPEDALRTDYQLRRFLSSPGESVSLRCRWRCRNGVWRHLECSGVNYRNNPDHAGVLFILRDITAQREAQERLIQARQAAENADRAKSEFLASMSHEIRTPMNAILGMAEVLSETDLSEEQRGYVELFRNAGESLLSLINDILDLSKVEAGQVDLEHIPFDLRELVEKLAHIMGIRARKNGVNLQCVLADNLPEIMVGDPGRLRQVLANLLSNAVKFTHQGRIDLEVRREPQEHGPDMLLFCVRDTGIGIPPNKIKDIFESFVQADSSTTRRYGGTGLGLSISQRLVNLMNGRIWVESEFGQGSSFYFSVPLDAPDDSPSGEHPRQAEDELERAIPEGDVLFVEDTESNRTLIEAYLEPTALRLDMAGDGREALEKFSSRRYDLVLMDMQLPLMNGYDAVRAIRKMERDRGLPRTPVFALTAFALKGDAEKCIQAGCDMHIAKPVQREEFLRILLEQLTHSGNEATSGGEPKAF